MIQIPQLQNPSLYPGRQFLFCCNPRSPSRCSTLYYLSASLLSHYCDTVKIFFIYIEVCLASLSFHGFRKLGANLDFDNNALLRILWPTAYGVVLPSTDTLQCLKGSLMSPSPLKPSLLPLCIADFVTNVFFQYYHSALFTFNLIHSYLFSLLRHTFTDFNTFL